MATIVYLDVDDEITSAAARIRGSDQLRVALVLPHASRLSTSRINFRLLAREARLHSRRLGIVAPDAATRALAASAGLPAFHSVGEYEASLDEPETTAAVTAAAAAPARPGEGLRAGAPPRGVRASPDAGAATLIIPAVDATDTGIDDAPTTAAAAVTGPARRTPDETPTVIARPDRDQPIDRPARERTTDAPTRPAAQERTDRGGPGVGVIVGLGILALAVLAAGVAGYVFLPSATVEIAPRVDAIGPLAFDIVADPTATEVDPEHGIVPAVTLDVPVSTTADFPATGKRVDADKATGTVRFDSINTVGPVFVPAGTRISTLGAQVFQTVRGVTVPRAQVNGTTIQHGIADVNVRAVKEGPDGNVQAGEITQVPTSLSTLQVSVRNNAPTKGGKREEFPVVQQADVDAAVAQLNEDLRTKFEAAAAAPAGLPQGATLFPRTAVLGEPQLSVDPQTLVGQEVEGFTLEASADGSVLAVNQEPLESMVRDRLTGMVAAGHTLVDDSIDVKVGQAIVDGQGIRFPVSGIAQQTAQLDVGALLAAIRGKPKADAEAILAPYGDASVRLWPDWVSAIPTLDQRVSFDVGTSDVPTVTAPPLPTPPPTEPPSASPSPSSS
jgi:hypothetical protein